MAWQIEATDEFLAWYRALTVIQQGSLIHRVDLLGRRGPDLGRPTVDRITTSRHHNMKELRAAKDGVLRVLFAFDPRRQVILLFGGDKSGDWDRWYERAVAIADDLYDEYLVELEQEGLL